MRCSRCGVVSAYIRKKVVTLIPFAWELRAASAVWFKEVVIEIEVTFIILIICTSRICIIHSKHLTQFLSLNFFPIEYGVPDLYRLIQLPL